jgi:hypothetical protein
MWVSITSALTPYVLYIFRHCLSSRQQRRSHIEISVDFETYLALLHQLQEVCPLGRTVPALCDFLD